MHVCILRLAISTHVYFVKNAAYFPFNAWLSFQRLCRLYGDYIVIRPHCMHEVQRCGLLLPLWRGLCLSVCASRSLSVGYNHDMMPTKTDKPIECRLGCGLRRARKPCTCVRWRPDTHGTG